jgi:hypothetical protein
MGLTAWKHVSIPHPPGSHLSHQALTDKMNGEGEDNSNFNGKYEREKYVFGDRKVFKDFIRLFQKTGAYWRGIHPERIVGFSPLIS